MSKLDEAVARALSLPIKGDWVEVSPNKWAPLHGWVDKHEILADLIDMYKICIVWHPDAWSAVVFEDRGSGWCTDEDRDVAALMAFCKHKGVAYE